MLLWLVRTDSDYDETVAIVSPNIASVEQAISLYANRYMVGIDDWHVFSVEEWELNRFTKLRTRLIKWADDTLVNGGIKWLDWGEAFIIDPETTPIEVKPR